ncbi:dUTP diphosphatase [Candidatus Parcubacteria bacterium]|nr:dUTP diphosphatase [Candidatus Parcubacteria bacterium]
MGIKIKRFDKEIPLPAYKTENAAGFDLYARIGVEIPPKEYAYIPLNVAVETPPGYFLLLVARSSTHKKGIWMANGIGIGDPDFSGDGDEYSAVYYNFTDKPVMVEKGERIAQGLIVKREFAQWEEVDAMPNKTRGGWGTTGK